MSELVALDLPPGPEWIAALRRAWDDGHAVLPVDQRLPPPARARLLDAMAPSFVVTADGSMQRPNGVPVVAGDAVVVATSGTTGEPKGVVLTHAAVTASAIATNARLGIDPTHDRWLATLPLAHIGGLSVVTRALASDTPVTVVAGFDPAVVDAAVASGHTRTSLVVSALQRIDPMGWTTILVGGSAIPPDLPANCTRTYGMTETGSGVVYDGFPVQGVGVSLSDDGEILLEGPMLLRAYRGPQMATASGRSPEMAAGGDGVVTPEGVNPLDSLGRLRTGDGGRFATDGALIVEGRRGDVIVTGGEKVWPDAVERALTSLRSSFEFAVAGQPDAAWGHRVTLFVVGASAPTLGLVRDLVSESLPTYAAPRAVVLVDMLPRTISAKVNRGALTALSTAPSESR